MQVQAIIVDRDFMEEFHRDTDIDHQSTLIKGTLEDISISMVDIDILTTHTEAGAIEGMDIEDMVIDTGKEVIDVDANKNHSQYVARYFIMGSLDRIGLLTSSAIRKSTFS
ncbi:hypothetical protein [Nitrosomonas communis]|uniref:Uncharacterized protein n=1 Tax=Nitrosomonas communis TaxID=44574 RepID=A0A1I4MNG7_9PROT|nr:hypothetical protein [Nitrosomonas communis]SFM04577.1 hypothetical protein SAMN05421863_10112 [Nitrosomonas communis]